MPRWFPFVTVEARTVLLAAGVTARQHGRTEITAEDVALALLVDRDGTAAAVWRVLRVDRDRLIRRLRPPEPPGRAGEPAVRFDVSGRRLWDRAHRVALLGGDRLGTRHLLFALLDAGPSPVVLALAEAGVTSRTAREVLGRAPEIEKLPIRPALATRLRWRWTGWRLRWATGWARWRRLLRDRPVVTIATLAPAAAVLFLGVMASLIR
ncbi:Clp protease N-terminal domain-containing protein [Plantactinospora sp. KBS50]|uniref:Clp protease N-terminal domain-containing protein n=1 Tax=Plantactinospora sp. KBS50 TaxID=2024580 RepID=UPI000BAAAAD7|nr:Clp protease N-terminal domain-containing protein [Plantactinospora sp. KBS50]ASW54364.1 hypothetical protein CIK06_09430 [Plantactinospora sp. KBS50]